MPEEKRFALRFGAPVAAQDLAEGEIVVVDGHVVEVGEDPDDPSRVRIVVDRALAGVKADEPDSGPVILSVPAGTKLATAS